MLLFVLVRTPPTTTSPFHSWKDAVTASLFGPGNVSAMISTALPTIAFAAVATTSSLTIAAVAATVTALGTLVYRVLVRQPLRPAVLGLVVGGVCAAIAASTGDARGFFLAPTAITVVIILVCLLTVVARRPLAGMLLNRLAGGPTLWYLNGDLLRVYTQCTLICVIVNIASVIAQIVGYLDDATWLLAALHIANPVIFTAIIAATLVAARKTHTT